MVDAWIAGARDGDHLLAPRDDRIEECTLNCPGS